MIFFFLNKDYLVTMQDINLRFSSFILNIVFILCQKGVTFYVFSKQYFLNNIK